MKEDDREQAHGGVIRGRRSTLRKPQDLDSKNNCRGKNTSNQRRVTWKADTIIFLSNSSWGEEEEELTKWEPATVEECREDTFGFYVHMKEQKRIREEKINEGQMRRLARGEWYIRREIMGIRMKGDKRISIRAAIKCNNQRKKKELNDNRVSKELKRKGDKLRKVKG